MGGRVAWRDHASARARISRKIFCSPLSRTSENGNGSRRSSLRQAGEVQNGRARRRLSSLGLALAVGASLVSRPIGRQQTEVVYLDDRPATVGTQQDRQQASNASDSTVGSAEALESYSGFGLWI
ncbi:hypothetical protein Adt_05117 [Abeliophyllum distichum]|uniref:Uncharacterized protein n=1 Tax=Abeliophyllum distichum TaxID=126358 RepID=A0ABD1V370_9LAMI